VARDKKLCSTVVLSFKRLKRVFAATSFRVNANWIRLFKG
jgi:hypothetical protein